MSKHLMVNIKSIAGVYLLMTSACLADPLSIDISSAWVAHEPSGQAVLAIELTGASRQAFQKFTEDHIGRATLLRVDGQVLLRSVVREPITTGSLRINDSNWTDEKVRVLADRLSQPGARLDVDGVD